MSRNQRHKAREFFFKPYELDKIRSRFEVNEKEEQAALKGEFLYVNRHYINETILIEMKLAELDGSDLLKFHPEAYLATSIRHFPAENPTQLYMTVFVELGNIIQKFVLKSNF